ncbi:MAG: hypothetical protein Q8881_02910 [Sweet potato little leaf phytoplasma]|nr:hypothetical protein [Sweet potato little leaf phytoplasma]
MNPDEFTPNFVIGDVSDETAEFPPNFALGDVSPETAEFFQNFEVRDVSDETAESLLPNFTMVTIPTKQPNFLQIFPRNCEISAQFRTRGRFRRNDRISAEFRTRGRSPRNGRIFVVFRTRDVSDETAEWILTNLRRIS